MISRSTARLARSAVPPSTVVLAVLVVSASACREHPSTNVLLISIDSLRSDHVHSNGYRLETTPALDGLAKEGTVWTGAVAPAPWTTPSMMSVMTGLPPDLHHVQEDDRMIDPSVPMLAERFLAAGYATAAFVPSVTLSERFGFARGFQRFDQQDFGHRGVTSPAQASALLHWLETTPGPIFAWVHFWDPHYNYNPPPGYDTRFVPPAGVKPPAAGAAYDVLELKNHRSSLAPDEVAWLVSQYDGEIAYTDKYVGEVLDALRRSGRLDTTLVVVLGDHGEAFQEHGWLTHTNTVYEETVRVPLIARLPNRLPAGRRLDGPVSLTDLTESLAVWAALPEVADSDRTLRLEPDEPARGAAQPQPDAAFVVSQTRRQATLLSARTGRWSLVLDYDSCRSELYDLETDPRQTRDLAESQPEAHAAVKTSLKRWIAAGRRAHPVPERKLELEDPELFQKLGALGYADLFGDRIGKRSEADPLQCL